MNKSCKCTNLIYAFDACTGEKCKVCKGTGHIPQYYCSDCHTFTHPVYGETR